MAKSLCRLRRLLRRAQLLILLLSVVYIMAGSILLLQRSAAPVSQRVGTPIQSLSAPSRAPPSAHWAPGAGWHHGGSGFRRPQDKDANERSGRNAGQVLARVTSWNRNLDRRRLRRHWFNSQVTQGELLVTSGPPHRPVRHKGIYSRCDCSPSLDFITTASPSSVQLQIPLSTLCTEWIQSFEKTTLHYMINAII